MQMQEIKTKMKHTRLAELCAARSPKGGAKPAGEAGQRGPLDNALTAGFSAKAS